jgi:hypothetical protein
VTLDAVTTQAMTQATTAAATQGTRGGGAADVAYVLLLVQAALGMLATSGLLVLMGGNPVYLIVGLGHPLLLAVLAGGVARRSRWALVTVTVLELLSLAAYQLNLWLDVLPQVDVTVNLVALLSQAGLPVAVAMQCLRVIRGA